MEGAIIESYTMDPNMSIEDRSVLLETIIKSSARNRPLAEAAYYAIFGTTVREDEIQVFSEQVVMSASDDDE